MLVVLGIAIAVLLAATAASLVVLRRSGDPRAGLLGAAFALLAGSAAAAAWSLDSYALGFDAASVAAFLALGACLLSPLAVWAVARTLSERDRSESLHWNSMEAVRALSELAGRPSVDPDQRLARLLEIGCEHFDLEIGMLARVEDGRYALRALRAPQDFPLKPGARLPLDATWCRRALESPRPVDFTRVSESVFADDAARESFPVESYLGTAVHCGGELWGSLAFASASPRESRFSATEKDLLTLMARWAGGELEPRSAPAVHSEAAVPSEPEAPKAVGRGSREVGDARPRPAPSTGWRLLPRDEPVREDAGRERDIDLNARLRRMERRLARAAGRRARVVLELAPGLGRARDLRVPLEGVLVSLVGHAAEAARGAARIVVASAELDLGPSQPGVLPAVAPDRYLTVSVRVAGDQIDTDALSCAFDAPAAGVSVTGSVGHLSLPDAYRLLQRGGGDLSVSVEEGRSVALTVFLPRAAQPSARLQRPVPVTAPPAG